MLNCFSISMDFRMFAIENQVNKQTIPRICPKAKLWKFFILQKFLHRILQIHRGPSHRGDRESPMETEAETEDVTGRSHHHHGTVPLRRVPQPQALLINPPATETTLGLSDIALVKSWLFVTFLLSNSCFVASKGKFP